MCYISKKYVFCNAIIVLMHVYSILYEYVYEKYISEQIVSHCKYTLLFKPRGMISKECVIIIINLQGQPLVYMNSDHVNSITAAASQKVCFAY